MPTRFVLAFSRVVVVLGDSVFVLTFFLLQIVLETEVSNAASLRLYERLGFLRSKRLHRYYLNGNAAFRLILYLKPGTATKGLRMRDEDEEPDFADLSADIA